MDIHVGRRFETKARKHFKIDSPLLILYNL
jgi:hypothetical protein